MYIVYLHAAVVRVYALGLCVRHDSTHVFMQIKYAFGCMCASNSGSHPNEEPKIVNHKKQFNIT